MRCRKCGKENANDDIYCIYCGSKLESAPVISKTVIPENAKAGTVSKKRSVKSILEEYLPQLSKTEEKRGGFAILPGVNNENCPQIIEDLLKDALPGGKKTIRERSEMVKKSIYENGETIQGVFVTGFSKLNYLPAIWIFSDRAIYAFWAGQSAGYLRNSGNKKKFTLDCKCWYDTIDEVSVIPAKPGVGISGLGANKVSCSLLNSADLFEFAFEKKYIQEDKLLEMIRLLKTN